MLDESTTRHLPRDWHGSYDVARARSWITERDAEAATSLVRVSGSGDPVGLLLVARDGNDARLGYIITAAASGQGYASELVRGVVAHLGDTGIERIVAGVAPDHAASIRVLDKAGFRRADDEDGAELSFEFVL